MRLFLSILCLAFLSACNGSPDLSGHDVDETLDDRDIEASGDQDIETPDDQDFSPTFISLSATMNPNKNTPLVGVVTAKTEPATRLRVTIDSDEGTETLRYTPLATSHRLPILGLLPGHTYTATVAAETADGVTKTYPETFPLSVPPLHADFPAIEHLNTRPLDREPGYLFIVLSKTLVAVDPAQFGFQLVAFDTVGNVRWLRQDNEPQHAMTILPGGRMLLQFVSKLIEVDVFGDIIGEWRVEGSAGGPLAVTITGIPRFHHSAMPTVNDTIITLSTETRTLENYPTSETDPDAPTATATVMADTIVEFERDGTSRSFHHLLDMLDPYRFGYGNLTTKQWSHANYALPIAEDDSIVLSVRNQSCIVKFDRATGDLRWILGNHDNWDPAFEPFLLTPTGTPFEWQWHQHNPKLTPQGTFLLFDNGTYRAMPFDTPTPATENWSRAVEYRVDELNMTVEQVWEWRPDGADRIFAAILGDINYLPQTGNVIVTFGGILKDMNDLPTSDEQNMTSGARIFEVNHTTPAQVLYEMRIQDTTTNAKGWLVHSSGFRSSLYPEGMLE